MAESMGYLANMAIHSLADFTLGVPVAMKYISNSLKETIKIEQNDSIRCTRSRFSQDVALGNKIVAGTIVLEPNPIELDSILTYLGFTVTATVWALDETIRDLYVRTCMTGTGNDLFTYYTRVSKWTLSAEPGKRVRLTLDLVGVSIAIVTSVASTYTFPAINSVSRPYMAYDFGSAISIAGSAYDVDKWELSCDHKIEPSFMMGATATDLEPTDRVVTVKVQTKFATAETALLTATRAGTSQTGSFTLTNGNMSVLITCGAMIGDSETPDIPGRSAKLRLPLTYYCYKTGSTKEVIITNDSSP